MKKIFTREERNELLDHVVAIAILTHQSGIEVAIELGLPDVLVSQLRSRAVRASQIAECTCPECTGEGCDIE